MNDSLLLFSLVFGLSTAAMAQLGDPSAVPRRGGETPAWLPRAGFLGTYVRGSTLTPQARLQWEVAFFEQRRDALVLVLDGGVGWAARVPGTAVAAADGTVSSLMDSFYEHTLMVGVGYRNQSQSGWHWGFQVTGGPVWYGAHFRDLPRESESAGLMEGRIQVGYRVGTVVLGMSGGYGEPFSFRRRSVSRQFLGGALFGFFADWR